MQKTILCVDDSALIRQWLEFSLQDAGYDVLTAKDGNEALALVESKSVDLVLTDLIQPGMDGIVFIKKFRAKQRYKFTPVLIMTTKSQEDRKYEGRMAGASEWIIKPFTVETLRKILDHYVG